MSDTRTLLLDNGSLEPAATLRLRGLAAALAARVGASVEAVSLLHSSGIVAEKLGGVPAEIFEPALGRRLAGGTRDFLVVPLFFGPSRALTEYLPQRVAKLKTRAPDLRVRLAPVLFDETDARLAEMLADHVRAAAADLPAPWRVALVDHGSPVPEVTAVRDALASRLAQIFGPAARVTGCCMERRLGAEFDFNGALLGEMLAQETGGTVTVAMQFLLPGRHAGADGDVAKICAQAEAANPRLRTRLTPLVAEHPRLIEILADRWTAGRTATPL
ncbi:MAG: cobalamin biosynthesis protein CbiX [Opitutae bacterium]|nr:cobalamin biosynthesis protein CbiX [Opitutae bacterium]